MLKKRSEKICVLLLITVYLALSYVWLNYRGISCVFLDTFGVVCPGCGMTRAFLSVLKLDFCQAAKYNVVIFFMPYVFLYVFLDFKHKIHNTVMIGIAVILIVNWAIKLINFF